MSQSDKGPAPKRVAYLCFARKSEDERTQEDILEFGADLDDDDDDEEEDAEFNRLLNLFMKGSSNTPDEEEDGDDNDSGYELLCELHEKPTEYLVHKSITEIEPERGLYVHVDLVIPDIEEENELRVEVTTLRGTEMIQGWFDKNNIPLFRDGDHLHLKPTLLTDLFGKEYKLDKDEEDQLVMILYKNEKEHYSRKIPIKGPWPSATKPYDSCMKAFKANEDIPEQMAIINERPGWQNFKARMDEMVSRCKVGALRKEAGLTSNQGPIGTDDAIAIHPSHLVSALPDLFVVDNLCRQNQSKAQPDEQVVV